MPASEKRLTMADPDRSLPGEEQPVEGAEVVTETPKQELRVKHMVQEWDNVLASGEVDIGQGRAEGGKYGHVLDL